MLLYTSEQPFLVSKLWASTDKSNHKKVKAIYSQTPPPS